MVIVHDPDLSGFFIILTRFVHFEVIEDRLVLEVERKVSQGLREVSIDGVFAVEQVIGHFVASHV